MNIKYMKVALEEAKRAEAVEEVPIGAVIVKNNKIIGRGYNLKETLKDPTMHAEIIAIKDASQAINSWRLTGCDMYVTIEPCVMCAGAISQARIKNLYIGSPDFKAGGVTSLYNILFDERLNHQVKVYYGIMRKECSKIIKDFFKSLRKGN